jgi:hypothetical protein
MSTLVPPLEDTAAMSVFADMLCVRGDPRGELVQLQFARERWPSDARLAREEAAHIARNDRALLGGLRTATSMCEFVWRRGYIVEAKLQSLARTENQWRAGRWVPLEPKKPKLPRLVRELLTLDSAQPLSMLTVALPFSNFTRDQLLGCAEVIAALRTPALAVVGLHALEPIDHDWEGSSWSPGATEYARVGDLHVSAAVGVANEVFARLG